MAEDNLNKIMNNAKSMTMEQLGSALIGRASRIRTSRQKQFDKREKIDKILAMLLGTQAIFKENVKRQTSNLGDLEVELKYNQRETIAKAKIIATIGNALPESIISAEDPYQAYLDDPKAQRALSGVISPILIAAMEKVNKVGVDDRVRAETLEYDVNSIINTVTAKHFLTRQKRLAIDGADKSPIEFVMDKGGKWLKMHDKNEIFSTLLGLSSGEQDKKITKRKREILSGIEDRSRLTGIFSTIGDMFNPEVKTAFAKQNDPDVLDDGFSSFMEQVKIGELLSPNYETVMGAWYATENFQTIAQGHEGLMSMEAGSRNQVATQDYLRELKGEAAHMGGKSQIQDQEMFKIFMENHYFENIREMDAINRLFFGTPEEQAKEEGKGTREKYRDTFASLRIAMSRSSEYRDMINKNYGDAIARYTPKGTEARVEKLDLVSKDKLAVHIIMTEGIDLSHSEFQFSNAPVYKRGELSAGTVKLYKNTKEIFGNVHENFGKQQGFWYNDEPGSIDLGSNFKAALGSSTSGILASLMPPIQGINDDGTVEVSQPLQDLMQEIDNARMQEKNHYTFASQVNNHLNDLMKSDHRQMTEQVYDSILSQYPNYKDIVTKEYGTILPSYEALQNSKLNTPIRYDDNSMPIPITVDPKGSGTGIGSKGKEYPTFTLPPEVQQMLSTLTLSESGYAGAGLDYSSNQSSMNTYIARIQEAYAQSEERRKLTPEERYGQYDTDI